MATEVLRSHDRLAADGFLHRRRNIHHMPSLIVGKRPYILNSNGHARKTSDSRRIDGGPRKTPSPSPSPPYVASPVTILRRGESSDSLTKSELNRKKSKSPSKSPNLKPRDGDTSVGGGEYKKMEDRKKKARSRGYRSCDDVSVCGGKKESPARQIEILSARDVYAGSGFCLSPSPRSLPLPSFFSNMKAAAAGDGDLGSSEAKVFADEESAATSGLRRLLRLD